MRFAVASQNFRTVTGHAGKTRRFLVFEVTTGQPPQEVERFDLPKEQSIHAFRGDGPHPLDFVGVVIAASAGDGFIRRMAARGVIAVATAETDPALAVSCYLAGTLSPEARTSMTMRPVAAPKIRDPSRQAGWPAPPLPGAQCVFRISWGAAGHSQLCAVLQQPPATASEGQSGAACGRATSLGLDFQGAWPQHRRARPSAMIRAL